MHRTDYQRTLYFLTLSEEAGFKSRHIEHLSNIFSYSSKRIDSLSTLIDNPYDLHPHKIFVFDYDNAESITAFFKKKVPQNNRGEMVVINSPQRLTTDRLISFGNLKGLFYTSAQYGEINRGLEEIVNGQMWLPRRTLGQLIHFYRHHFENINLSAAMNLTSREVEILKSLEAGGSNQAIADSLFISEPTVKSHLYQIYKKIAVKNRAQAISWARNNCV
ncbi:LuxR C-terminal-related transcriptional regulator [Vibrio sp.]|uniref:DNA-binding response regulator n=2 Tax=Vibrio viridaestus TaxID=2487322 RepID=A0A3N9TFB6_9VIBR|nr:LuxR C-terminal-related transcriptional regulator [Vibrio sp.]RQW62819.1 DNA-binding response regulator [Vibrio viridaestus]